MLLKTSEKLSKTYLYLWLAMTGAYAVWMTFFLKYDTYPSAETGIPSLKAYVVWTLFSIVVLLLFPVYIKLFLYGREPGKALKYFCLIGLVAGCAYITWYCFLKNPFEYTASMIGLEYPLQFKLWGLLSSVTIFTNVLYMYRINGYHSRAGVICGSIGCAAIFVTINVPSAGEDLILNSLRCMSHWTGALVFAFMLAASVIVFLANRAKSGNAKYKALLTVFALILLTMLVLLVVVGKDGIIEGIPSWASYLLLFLVNFTGLFKDKPQTAKPEEAPAETEDVEETAAAR